MRFYLKIICMGMGLLALYGCGDGGSGAGGGAVSDSYVFPAGKATLTFSAISTARLPAPINGINFSLKLPQGMNVTTTSGTSDIDLATITPGYAPKGSTLVFGTYSTSTRRAYLGMATSGGSYRSGRFMRLVCTVDSGSSITLGDLKSTNSPVPIIQAVGYNSGSTVALTDKIKVDIGAVK